MLGSFGEVYLGVGQLHLGTEYLDCFGPLYFAFTIILFYATSEDVQILYDTLLKALNVIIYFILTYTNAMTGLF